MIKNWFFKKGFGFFLFFFGLVLTKRLAIWSKWGGVRSCDRYLTSVCAGNVTVDAWMWGRMRIVSPHRFPTDAIERFFRNRGGLSSFFSHYDTKVFSQKYKKVLALPLVFCYTLRMTNTFPSFRSAAQCYASTGFSYDEACEMVRILIAKGVIKISFR